LTEDYQYSYPSSVEIQYFPNESGINKYRIVCVGRKAADGYIYANYCKGDGTGMATNTIIDVDSCLGGLGRDRLGDGNRLVGYCFDDSTKTVMYEFDSNADYASGVLSWDNHGKQDLLASGTADTNNGYSSAAVYNLIFNIECRVVVLDKKAYIIHGITEGAGHVYNYLFWSKDVTSGTWETTQYINDNKTMWDLEQEYCCVYVSIANSIMFGWKEFNYDAGWGENITEGQIWARLCELSGDGTPIWHDGEQVDGGEAHDANFNGYAHLTSSADSAIMVYEYKTGANNTLRWNDFK